MMEELAKLLESRDIQFHSRERHIMCFPHVINLCTQAVLATVDNPNSEEIKAMYANVFDDPNELDEYVAAINKRPITSGREIVRTIRASGLRRDQFDDLVKTGNEKGWFQDAAGTVVVIPEVQLLRDVPTRWDATLYMLNRLRVLRPVSDHFFLISCQRRFSCIRSDLQPIDHFLAVHKLTSFQISSDEWDVLKDCEMILEVSVHSSLVSVPASTGQWPAPQRVRHNTQ